MKTKMTAIVIDPDGEYDKWLDSLPKRLRERYDWKNVNCEAEEKELREKLTKQGYLVKEGFAFLSR